MNQETKTEISKYFKEIENAPILSSEEEMDLCKKVENGDVCAKERLREANMYLILKVFDDCSIEKTELADYVESGKETIIAAIEAFDYRENIPLSTWLYYNVRKTILEIKKEKEEAEERRKYYQSKIDEKYNRLKEEHKEIFRYCTGIYGEEPHTFAETAKKFNVSRERVSNIVRSTMHTNLTRSKKLKDFLD